MLQPAGLQVTAHLCEMHILKNFHRLKFNDNLSCNQYIQSMFPHLHPSKRNWY